MLWTLISVEYYCSSELSNVCYGARILDCLFSQDELLWAAIWLHEATGEAPYLQYVIDNGNSLGGTGWALDQFSWDNKYVGVQLKATKILLAGNGGSYTSTLDAYRVKAEYFLCGALQKNSGGQITKSPGGMFWIQNWNNMQYVTTAAFLLTVASDYYEAAHATLQHCTSSATNAELLAAGKEQVDYILGKNGRGTSYLVGFGSNYPQRVHHRAASIPSPVACSEGFNLYYFVQSSNPHVIEGAITGGPDANDNYNDQRDDYAMSEPVTYNTAPMVGVLARLSIGSSLASALSDPTSANITPQDVIGKRFFTCCILNPTTIFSTNLFKRVCYVDNFLLRMHIRSRLFSVVNFQNANLSAVQTFWVSWCRICILAGSVGKRHYEMIDSMTSVDKIAHR